MRFRDVIRAFLASLRARRAPAGLCERCAHRRESRARVVEVAHLWEGRERPRPLLVVDLAPKAECKRHEGYGVRPAETVTHCRDFLEDGA